MAGLEVDAVLEVRYGHVTKRFAVEEKRRAPYPHELERLEVIRTRLARTGRPLLIVPFVTAALGASLTAAGWSWADAAGNFDLRAPGLLLRQRSASTPARPKRTTLPHGSGSLAIIRALIRFTENESEELAATTMAAQARVSQPRASQVLHQLRDMGLVHRTSGRWAPDREALLDRFLADYRGPGGSEHLFYSLDPPMVTARRAVEHRSRDSSLVVSADVGPDLLIGWRRPSTVVMYSRTDLATEPLGIVPAQGRHDANVIVRIPDDLSVFPVPDLVATLDNVEVPLADPTQQIWDLHDLGGADRVEAAGRLREWLLTGH